MKNKTVLKWCMGEVCSEMDCIFSLVVHMTYFHRYMYGHQEECMPPKKKLVAAYQKLPLILMICLKYAVHVFS